MHIIKALFTYDYGKEKMDMIKNLGYDVMYIPEKQVSYDNNIKNIDVLVCYNPFDHLNIDKLKKLKWIQLSSIGIDQAPKDILKKNDVILTNNKGGYSIPIGEWVVLKALELLKNSKKMYENQQDKIWQLNKSILELYNKTVGFIGTGSIAKESAKRLKGFDVNIIGINTTGKDISCFDKCYSIKDMETMLPLCDIVVITVPYTAKTHHLINNKIISMMKNGVYIINIARGSIINEKDLITNLNNKKIAGAALDVFETEPLSQNSPLWNFDNVIITPHNSWISEMRNVRRFKTIYENMKRYINNNSLLNIVDLNKGY